MRPSALDPYREGRAPPLRDRLRELGPSVVDVEVDDEAVLVDLDTPAAAAAQGMAPIHFFDRGPGD
ncbi:MAG: hypothetical protein JRI23_04585 [Deltaproteobacteria bacterium]|nr:hypothetical protein [Deltaproteobacteria bacterium]MBW2530825.1 hypothetical protein [Deltaproteobacteria bacterium]